MHAAGPKNPLHGITLEQILVQLHEHYGWEGLADRLRINCFHFDPSIKSSLKFLRKAQWARTKVEDLYLYMVSEKQLAAEAEKEPGVE
jgi:uncharacterized protein (DUF2132 family)